MSKTKVMQPMDNDRLARLLCGQRWACLGSLNNGRPFVSWAAYVVDESGDGLLLHLSRLARHTRNLLADARASLAISEADAGHGDPQLLARITLEGEARLLERDSDEYADCRRQYLACLPEAEMLFGFEDFSLFRFVPQSAHYVEGFGSTHRLSPEQLRQVICDV